MIERRKTECRMTARRTGLKVEKDRMEKLTEGRKKRMQKLTEGRKELKVENIEIQN